MRMRWLKKIKHWFREDGLSLIEIVMILVIVGIALVPLSRLSVSNLKTNARQQLMNRCTLYAEELVEWVVSDYRNANFLGEDVANDWVGYYDNPEGAITRYVSVSGPTTLNSVDYWEIDVSVSAPDMEDVVLTIWITR